MPNIFGQYSMSDESDYAQQTRAINAIDDETITELMRIICYNQSIYDDMQLEDDEWLGLTLSVDSRRASVLTNIRPMYDQAAIMIQDNDSEFDDHNIMCNTTYSRSISVYLYISSCCCAVGADILPSSRRCGSSGDVC